MKDRNIKTLEAVSIVIAATLLLSYFLCSPGFAFTLNPDDTYVLQNQTITNITSSQIILENGTVILLDAPNLSAFLPQMTSTEITREAATFYTNSQKYITQNLTYDNTTPAFNPNATYRIQQGDCVTLGETIDISGDGWYTGQLSYYGPYFSDYSDGLDSELVATYPIDSWNLTQVYIDPAFFSQYPGWWYVYYQGESWGSNTTSGYDRIFYVGQTCNNPNQTIAQQYITNITYLNQLRAANLSELPEKTESNVDFIVSRNETTSIPVSNGSTIWMFGRVTGIYNTTSTSNNTTVLDAQDTVNYELGWYSLYELAPDLLGICEIGYDKINKEITSPFKTIPDSYVGSLQPYDVEQLLQAKIAQAPNTTYIKAVIDLQNPDIQIMKLDQWLAADNTTEFEIAGYTNSNAGDPITITYDVNKTTEWMHKNNTWIVNAWGNQNAYRQWNLTLDLNLQGEVPITEHFFTVTSNDGAAATIPFYINQEPATDYQPQVYLNFIGNSPFIPTPTPITIVKQLPAVTVTVPVTVVQIEKEPVDYKTLSFNIVATAIPYVIVGVILFFVLRYILSRALVVWKEHKEK